MTETHGLTDGYNGHNPRAGLEHREWCRRRALYYLNQGEIANALAGLCADLARNADTKHLVDRAADLQPTYESVYNFVEYL